MGELKTAVFCCVKLENNYIREFVEHYQKLGFTNIILADNNDDEHLEDVIQDYIQLGFVKIEDFRGWKPDRTLQNRMYQILWNKYKQDYDWILVVDADEFLELEKPLSTVSDFLSLDQFRDVDEIRVAWKLYGDNGLLNVQGGDYSLEHRFKRDTNIAWPTREGITKAFLRGHRDIWFNPECQYCSHHGANIQGITRDVDVLGNPVNHKDHRWKPVLTLAWLNHYNTKTLYEFIDTKVRRGTAEATNIPLRIYHNINRWWTREQLEQAISRFNFQNINITY